MTTQQFRKLLMLIVIIAGFELVIGLFYYFAIFKPQKEMKALEVEKETYLAEKEIEQEKLLEETKIKEATRMEEIKLEVKEIDLELARIERWDEAGDEFEQLREEEEATKGKTASLLSCMKIVVENYHNQWNSYCEELDLPNSCLLPEKETLEINGDYEIGKEQCEDFFSTN